MNQMAGNLEDRAPRAAETAAVIRNWVLEGRYGPGQRLPTRARLLTELGVSAVTLQRACDRLQADGFLVTRGKGGTHVAEMPPHLCDYAVVVAREAAGRELTSRYPQAVARQVEALAAAGGPRRVRLYQCVIGAPELLDGPALAAQVVGRRVAGLVFASHPYPFAGQPVLTVPGVPRVAFMSDAPLPGVDATLWFDMADWLEQAVEYLAQQGCRRLAMISALPDFEMDEGGGERFERALVQHGMACPRSWRQAVTPRGARAARNLVALLWDRPAGEQPDGLLVTDDNLTEEVCLGLLAAGVQVPVRVRVVSHANLPSPRPRVLPVQRLGFDQGAVLATAFGLIDRLRAGEAVPGKVPLRATFERPTSATEDVP